jgi:hypothetical protein
MIFMAAKHSGSNAIPLFGDRLRPRVLASPHDRENLVAAMFDGRKRAPREGDIA